MKIKYLSILLGLLLLSFFQVNRVQANNIRIVKLPELTLLGDSVEISFSLSWDNSWRDEYNWDAAWVFVKCKKEGATTAWSHVNLGRVTSLPADLSSDFGLTGANPVGVFIYRNALGEGDLVDKEVKLKVAMAHLGNPTASEITSRRIHIAVSAIEMVFIPHGPYYLGDGKSKNSFRSVQQRIIPASEDIIDLRSGYQYSCIPMPYYSPPELAANRVNNGNWDPGNVFHISSNQHGAAAAKNNSWIVKFDSPKTIRSFGVSGSTYPPHYPVKPWYLLASNDSVVWDTLWKGGPEHYIKDANSYPVRHSLRVTNPQSRLYYRIYIPTVEGTSGVMIANVAMSESDLYPEETDMYLVASEEMTTGKNLNQLYTDDGDTWTDNGGFNANYPKGYQGFYVMKYEVSQEQYVSFLNMLDRTQQAVRIGNPLATLLPGEYVFGAKGSPSVRNGICMYINLESRPAVFANNLNPAAPYFGADDGQTIACNYLTPEDMLAYLDWSGLRPLSEMEYEKAGRRPYPQQPTALEYAWNNLSIAKIAGVSDVNNQGKENEIVLNNKNANAGNSFGPVRCGSFGHEMSTQTRSGGSFWGVMEMSGNLSEIYYSAGNSGRAFHARDVNNSHGDGVLAASGLTDVSGSYWPVATTAANFVLRGGGFSSPDSLLRISDRSILSKDHTRDSTVTFRGGRTFTSSTMTLNGGSIAGENGLALDTACPGTPMRIRSLAPGAITNGNGLSVNYIWYINDDLLPGEVGEELVYDFDNATTTLAEYKVKRKTMSAVGEAWATDVVTIKAPNTNLSLDINRVNIDYNGLPTTVTASAVQTGYTLSYTWKYEGNVLGTGTKFSPARHHFNGAMGKQNVYCVADIIGCEASAKLEVNVSSETVVSPNAVSMSNCGKVLFLDERNGTKRWYPTVKIADPSGNNAQCWLAKNMDIGERVEGSDIAPENTLGIQKFCYANLEFNCDRFGGLYTWREAMYGGEASEKMTGAHIQGICPDGWHVPNQDEWARMEMNLGATLAETNSATWSKGGTYGTKMKAPVTIEGETFCSGPDCNSSGFNGLPAGRKNGGSNGWEYPPGSGSAHDSFWLATYSGSEGMTRHLYTPSATSWSGYGHGFSYGLSIRCIKN